MRAQEAPMHVLPDHILQYVYSFCPEMACNNTAVSKRFNEVLCDLPGVVIRPRKALPSEVGPIVIPFRLLFWYAFACLETARPHILCACVLRQVHSGKQKPVSYKSGS
jgi:hypothetical protein